MSVALLLVVWRVGEVHVVRGRVPEDRDENQVLGARLEMFAEIARKKAEMQIGYSAHTISCEISARSRLITLWKTMFLSSGMTYGIHAKYHGGLIAVTSCRVIVAGGTL